MGKLQASCTEEELSSEAGCDWCPAEKVLKTFASTERRITS